MVESLDLAAGSTTGFNIYAVVESLSLIHICIANQIPDTPKNFGNKIKLGIRKTKPRNKAKIVAGFILSTL